VRRSAGAGSEIQVLPEAAAWAGTAGAAVSAAAAIMARAAGRRCEIGDTDRGIIAEDTPS
jgi:hypothetical protein